MESDVGGWLDILTSWVTTTPHAPIMHICCQNLLRTKKGFLVVHAIGEVKTPAFERQNAP